MSIGVIIIMLAVILILTWICLVKYRGLEMHARKIWEKYRNKSTYNQNKFTLWTMCEDKKIEKYGNDINVEYFVLFLDFLSET